MNRRHAPALFATLLAAGGVARADDAAAPPSGGFEVRAGALVPRQILDGANLHAAVAGRYRLAGTLWAHVETGLDRTTVSGLTTDVLAPGGAVRMRADHAQWTVPVLAGLAWRQGEAARPRFGATLAGGIAWSSAELRGAVVNGEGGSRVNDQFVDLAALARFDAAWPLRSGEALLGLGWREGFPVGNDDRPTGDVRSAGLLMEAGWRVVF